MRISYSALEAFRRCPAKFKFQYIDKIKTPKSRDALFGTLIHKTLKILHEPALTIPTEEEILKFFANSWDNSIYPNEQEAAAVFAQGIKILKDYYAKNYPANFNVVALETMFEVPIKGGDELHLITGKIDRVDKTPDGLFEVIDYKTAKKMPSQEAVEKDLQLAVYHLGLANRWPSIIKEKRPVKVSLYYLKHGEKLSSLRQASAIDETQENMLKIIKGVSLAQKEEKFDPKPNPLCDWCEYQRFCPLFKHKFIEERLFFNDQDVKALLNEYSNLNNEIEQKNKRLKEIKNDLSRFMNQEGFERLFGNDGYLSRQIIQSFNYNPELLRQILEPIGRWQEILKIDDLRLKKILKELPREKREKIEQARQLAKEYKKISFKKEKNKFFKGG